MYLLTMEAMTNLKRNDAQWDMRHNVDYSLENNITCNCWNFGQTVSKKYLITISTMYLFLGIIADVWILHWNLWDDVNSSCLLGNQSDRKRDFLLWSVICLFQARHITDGHPYKRSKCCEERCAPLTLVDHELLQLSHFEPAVQHAKYTICLLQILGPRITLQFLWYSQEVSLLCN